jgi:hypothetical protein
MSNQVQPETVRIEGRDIRVVRNVEGLRRCMTSHSAEGGYADCALMLECKAIDDYDGLIPCPVRAVLETEGRV